MANTIALSLSLFFAIEGILFSILFLYAILVVLSVYYFRQIAHSATFARMTIAVIYINAILLSAAYFIRYLGTTLDTINVACTGITGQIVKCTQADSLISYQAAVYILIPLIIVNLFYLFKR